MAKFEYHFAAIYETRLLAGPSLTVVAPPVKLEVMTGPAYMYRLSWSHAVIPFSGEVGEETEIPPPTPIQLEEGKDQLVVSTRASGDPRLVEDDCRRIVSRVIAIVALLSVPTLFGVQIYEGWIGSRELPPVHATVVVSQPQHLDRKSLEKNISIARNFLAGDAAMRNRFDLIARLFNRALAGPPGEDTFLWAWICLEVFPMMGSQKYRCVAKYLATMSNGDETELASRLDIRGLYRLRSKLVHAGHLGLGDADLFNKIGILRGVVYTVMRGMCGLPYDGELERVCPKGA